MDPITHTQHCLTRDSVKPVEVPQQIRFSTRSNTRKADWNEYSTERDKLIEDLDPISGNYRMCVWYPDDTYQEHVEQYIFPV